MRSPRPTLRLLAVLLSCGALGACFAESESFGEDNAGGAGAAGTAPVAGCAFDSCVSLEEARDNYPGLCPVSPAGFTADDCVTVQAGMCGGLFVVRAEADAHGNVNDCYYDEGLLVGMAYLGSLTSWGAGRAPGDPQGCNLTPGGLPVCPETGTGGAAGSAPTHTGGVLLGGPVHVASWMLGPGDLHGVEALATQYDPTYPQGDLELMRQEVPSLRDIPEPPYGVDVYRQFVGINVQRRADQGALAALDGLSFWDAIPQALQDQVSVGGVRYAVPTSVYRVNSVYYSKAVLGADYTPPPTLDAFHDELERVKAMDPAVVPLAVGNQYAWTADLLLWEMVVPAVGGGGYYDRFWHGEADLWPGTADDAVLQAALREMLVLWCGVNNVDPDGLALLPGAECDGYVAPGANQTDWELQVEGLGKGMAAFMPMGDWAKGALMAADYTLDDFGVFQFPGEDVFVWTATAFAMPSFGPHPEAARTFLTIAGSKEGQVAFNLVGGGIPARADIGAADGLDEMSLGIAEQFSSNGGEAGGLVPSRWTLLPYSTLPDLPGELRAALELHDMTPLYAYFIDHYAHVAAAFQ